MKLPTVGPGLGGLQVVLLPPDELGAERLRLLLEEREEVGAVESAERLELVDAHDDGGRAAVDVRVGGGRRLERALQEWWTRGSAARPEGKTPRQRYQAT